MKQTTTQRASSQGIRGCVQKKLFHHMFDAVPGKYNILVCDVSATAVLNNCVQMDHLLEHNVTLVEDLMTQRQPIVSSAVLYFFDPTEETVKRLIDEWCEKHPYKEVHIFALGRTPDVHLQQLAKSQLAPRVCNFKDMLLDFFAPERLVFHFNMSSVFLKLLGAPSSPLRSNFMDVAATRLVSVIHTINDGLPIIRYQKRSSLCEEFAAVLHSKLSKLPHCAPEFAKQHHDGEDNTESPLLIILDRSFDTVTPLMHHRTYQCLLEDLTPLSGNMYEQTFDTRQGSKSTRQLSLDEEDPYWCRYRHRFFAECMEEIPAELKKLHEENPNLSSKRDNMSIAELGSAARLLPAFQKKQARLSMHVDICSKIIGIYREQRLAEVCEVEQDIAAERQPFKANLNHVRALVKDITIPRLVRLRLLLLFSATADTSEFPEMKKKQLIQEAGLEADAECFARLQQITSRVGWLGAGGDRKKAHSGKAESGDPFLSQAYRIMEAVARDKLDVTDYTFLNGHRSTACSAAASGKPPSGEGNKKSLRVSMKHGNVQLEKDVAGEAKSIEGAGDDANDASSAAALRRAAAKRGEVLDLGNSGGLVPLSRKQRIVLFVLGGVTFEEIRAAYEASKVYGREFIIGGTCLLRPNELVESLNEEN
ncbi:putative syntaxin binding protein 1 [Trypanosoma vivax]|nr:putative syntaxin binding protein 1 [Trypanosoma vivax]